MISAIKSLIRLAVYGAAVILLLMWTLVVVIINLPASITGEQPDPKPRTAKGAPVLPCQLYMISSDDAMIDLLITEEGGLSKDGLKWILPDQQSCPRPEGGEVQQ